MKAKLHRRESSNVSHTHTCIQLYNMVNCMLLWYCNLEIPYTTVMYICKATLKYLMHTKLKP